MPKSNSQSPKVAGKRRADVPQFSAAARNKGFKRPANKKPAGKKPAGTKPASLSALNTNRKRKPSLSSVSTISSLSGFEESDQDEADSEASSDDDDDKTAHRTPSYGGKSHRGRKAGSKKLASSPLSLKKRKLSYDEGYEGQQSSAGDSDSDYGAVDEISDDDDDEDVDVEQLEEQMILDSEDERQIVGSGFSHSDALEPDQWVGLGSFDDHILFSAEPFLDDQLYSAMETFGETDLTSEAIETPIQRHVHFITEENSDSSSDSPDGSTDDEIPGDFLQQDSLDPTLRRMIDNDHDGGNNQRYEDIFGESDFKHPANIYHVESDAVSDGSSGYETDDGETTDEDLPPPATITHPRSILRRDSTSSLTATGDSASQPSNPPRRRGPIMGSFVPDPKKPVALVDCTGKHLVIIPAYSSSRHDWLESATNSICGTATNSPRATTMHLVEESDTEALASPNGLELNPMLNSGNLMMTALGNDATPGGQVMGPPEAFYAAQTFGGDSSYEDEDDEDDEAMLNVDDFIDFGNGSSDEEEIEKNSDDEGVQNSPVASSSAQALRTPTPSRNDSNSAEQFLNHLDKGIVTAFRRNNTRYQTLIRLPQHREFMPANSPSRVASVFRHSRYSDPRTPPRKRKASNLSGGETVRRKLIDGHRRNQLSF